MTAREAIFSRVRTALGRQAGQPVPPPPVWPLDAGSAGVPERVDLFRRSLEALNGKVVLVHSQAEAGAAVAAILDGRTAVASPSPFLESCGINRIERVRWGISDPEEWRQSCAAADAGITSAAYALADTGSLVMIASPSEPRLASLLPPLHIAVIPAASILTGLEELFLTVPEPAKLSPSMVLITGPSRTADIEQILVRGVHGPGEVHVVVVQS
ncbi:MAG TPA: lactate utilization protein [Bryobacteraceae bacterium]|nr:lactate utilization protein [Bryobacteraceae bacterium]